MVDARQETLVHLSSEYVYVEIHTTAISNEQKQSDDVANALGVYYWPESMFVLRTK